MVTQKVKKSGTEQESLLEKAAGTPRGATGKAEGSGLQGIGTRKHLWIMLVIWTLFVGLVLLWSLLQKKQETLEAARIQARSAFEKDLAYRRWAAGHGGVYVPVTEQTPPSPYLSDVKDRDVTTPSGRQLTLLNPAYMTRQVHELEMAQHGLVGHITSLAPIRVENRPDDWERVALESFEDSVPEVSSIEQVEGEAHMRLMRPLITTKRCLTCHAEQGQKVGAVRGGISIAVPMEPLWAIAGNHAITLTLGHGLLWVLGLGGIALGNRRLGSRMRELERAERRIREQNDFLRSTIDSLAHPFYVIDAHDYTVKMANRTATENLAMKEGVTCYALTHRLDQPCGKSGHLCPVDEIANTGDPAVVEHVHYDRDGQERIMEVHGYPIFDEQGEVSQVIEYSFDITARRQTEEALRASEERYRSYIEVTGQLGWTTNARGEVEEDLPTWRRFTGQSEEEIKGAGWLKVIHPDDIEHTTKMWKEAVASESPVEIEYRARRSDGTYRHLLDRGMPAFNNDGSIREWVGTCIDLTERKQAEKEIAQLAKFPSENPNPVLRTDEDGCVLYANEAGTLLLDMWGCGVGQRVSENWRRTIAEVLTSGSSKDVEVDYEDRVFVLTFAPLVGAGCVNLYGLDITERKRAEQAVRKARDELESRVQMRTADLSRTVDELQQSETRLAEAQRLAHLGNWDWDIIKNELWWSDEIYRIVGLNPREFSVTYEAFLSLVHPDDREFAERSVNEALDAHVPYGIDHRIVTPDNEERIVHEQAEVICSAEGEPVQMRGTIQDITERKRAEEALIRYQKQLQSLTSELTLTEERQRRDIAEGLHDNVGQLLTAVNMKLEYLEGSAPVPDLSEALAPVRELVREAIKYTRTLTFELSPPRLYTLGFESALRWLAEQMNEQYGIQCDFECDKRPKPLAQDAQVLLYRTTRELLNNVVKHAMARKTRMSVSRRDDCIQISVEDDGVGFDSSEINSDSGSRNSFGLFSVRERLNYLKGSLEIHSGLGQGTQVLVTVPLSSSTE